MNHGTDWAFNWETRSPCGQGTRVWGGGWWWLPLPILCLETSWGGRLDLVTEESEVSSLSQLSAHSPEASDGGKRQSLAHRWPHEELKSWKCSFSISKMSVCFGGYWLRFHSNTMKSRSCLLCSLIPPPFPKPFILLRAFRGGNQSRSLCFEFLFSTDFSLVSCPKEGAPPPAAPRHRWGRAAGAAAHAVPAGLARGLGAGQARSLLSYL